MWDHFQCWNMTPPLVQEQNCTKYVKCIFGIIFQRLNMTHPLLAEKRIPQDFIYLGSFFNIEIWLSPSYGRESSFFNVEIWPHLLAEKGLHTNVRCICGINFQCWNMIPPLVQKRIAQKMLNTYLESFFIVEIWPPPSWQRKGFYKNFYIRDHFSTF
jgi:hypothetical protein